MDFDNGITEGYGNCKHSDLELSSKVLIANGCQTENKPKSTGSKNIIQSMNMYSAVLKIITLYGRQKLWKQFVKITVQMYEIMLRRDLNNKLRK